MKNSKILISDGKKEKGNL